MDASDSMVATGSADGTIRIGRVSGEEPHVLLGQQGSVHSVAFSPDGRWLATAGEAFAIRLWPVPDMLKPPLHRQTLGELLTLLRSHTNLRAVPTPVRPPASRSRLAHSPAGRRCRSGEVASARCRCGVDAPGRQGSLGAGAARGNRRDRSGHARGRRPRSYRGRDRRHRSPLETVTDGSGTYRFATLPPGRYEVTARLTGFLPARVVNIDLALGVQLTIDLVLKPAGPNETVEVVSESPLVAVTQSAGATNLRNEQIEKLPRGRDFTSLAIQAAGTNDERKLGGISIDGSSGAENRIIIDGVETTDTTVGTPGQLLVTDFVHELQIKSSGYSAEYGGSTGGVLNVITKSGSNAWHGEALVYGSGDALDAALRPRCNSRRPTRAVPNTSRSPRTTTGRWNRDSRWAGRSCATGCGCLPDTSRRSGLSIVP